MKALMAWWDSFREQKLPSAMKAARTGEDRDQLYRTRAKAFNQRMKAQNQEQVDTAGHLEIIQACDRVTPATKQQH